VGQALRLLRPQGPLIHPLKLSLFASLSLRLLRPQGPFIHPSYTLTLNTPFIHLYYTLNRGLIEVCVCLCVSLRWRRTSSRSNPARRRP
jgi:hypothetical protein